MAITSGFFNSLDGDRIYDAEDMGAMFDGLISDGVFESVGTKFNVTTGNGLTVVVGSGRAWLGKAWVYNESNYTVSLSSADVTNPRIDAIVIEVDRSDSVRAASIKAIKGTAAPSPSKPNISNNLNVYRLPIAFVTIPAGSMSISATNVESVVGTASCPYTSVLISSGNISETGDLSFKNYVYVEMTKSGNWIAPSNILNNEVEVMSIGGGGAGGSGSSSGAATSGGGGGGGSGHIVRSKVKITPQKSYPAIIGSGGIGVAAGNGGNGGTTSFGDALVVAAGGSGGKSCDNGGAGGDGAAGGGAGSRNSSAGAKGGNGDYLGGGGGAGGYTGIGGNGGSGGYYGGGGGGGSGSSSGTGGAGGHHGGDGGKYNVKGNDGSPLSENVLCYANTKLLTFTFSGMGGAFGTNYTAGTNQIRYGGGGGGGGFGGDGGNGGNGLIGTTGTAGGGSGGGGGGGFGGNGGNGSDGGTSNGSGGGGGGGFGGNGGNASSVSGGGGGGFGGNGGDGGNGGTGNNGTGYGSGGGGGSARYAGGNGAPGAIILMYYVAGEKTV